MRKYVFSIVLALCLVAALLPGIPAAADGHNHTCLCGAENCTQTGTGHEKIPDDAVWEGIGNREFESGTIGEAGHTHYYYLTENIDCDAGNLGIYFEGNVVLCLNGHNIKFTQGQNRLAIKAAADRDTKLTICDCDRTNHNCIVEYNDTYNNKKYDYTYYGGAIKGYRLDISSGTLNLYRCTITGSNNAAAINMASGTTLNMYDGANVLGNSVREDSAVSVRGEFNMYGGLIAGNYANSAASYGGGVRVGGSITAATFHMYDGTIQDNMADNGGGVSVTGGSTFYMHGGTIENNATRGGGWQNYGGGVLVHSGTFNMYGGTITGNQTGTGNGGGLALREGTQSTANIYGGTISDNTSHGYGGGIYVSGNTLNIEPDDGKINITGNMALDNEGHQTGRGGGMYLGNLANGTLTLDQVNISNNTAEDCGGGLFVSCDVDLEDGASITGNGEGLVNATSSAHMNGGGVYLAGGTFNLNGGEISNNKDDILNGAGVYVAGGTFNLNSGKINGNEAKDSGGGVYVAGGTFNLNGGEISGNEASSGGGMDYEAGKVTINKGSTISGNVANYGGGVLVSGKDITMSGGSITGNGTKGNNYRYGGGVCIAQYTDHDTQTPYSGVFTMTGGSITGNTAGSRGAGVYFLNGGTFKVSGDANVTGNTVGNSANNVYLTDTDGVLTIIGPLNGAGFGITAKSDTHFTSGWSNCMSGSDPTQFFTSDLDNRYVTLSGDEVELRDGYQIKYELNGGQFVSSYTPVSSYDGNQDVQLPGVDKITRNGYTFGGWYDNEGLTGEPYTVIPSGSTGPKTFYAKWMANTYTVEFEPNGGTINGSYVTNYTYGEGAALPTDVEKSGYTFAGWYENDRFEGSAVTAISDTEYGDKTYYAKWMPKTYSVTLNTNGGTIKSGNVTNYTYGEGAALPTDVEKSGYTFAGWYDNEELTGSAVTAISDTEYGDKTYYAKWTSKTYSITFNTDGGTIKGNYVTGYSYGEGAVLPTDVEKSGYTFAGWYDNEELTGSAVTAISDTEYGDKTYYAKWTANTYSITFNTNGGTIKGNYVTGYSYGKGAELPTDVEKSGYTFAGWYGNEQLTGSAATAISNTEYGDKTYYAKWTANTYSVKLHLNGGNLADGVSDITAYTYGNSIELPDRSEIVRSGYMFSGWYADEGFKDGPYTEISSTDSGNKEFYARWTMYNIPNTHAITVIDPANGSLKVNPSNGSAGTLITVTATPDKGYELAYITVDGERITGSTFRMPDHDVTVSALFVPVSFPFTDVKSGDWFYDAVAYVYASGLMDGTSATTFEPNANMTRAMVWAILARIDGETVTGADWADTARTWAMASGVSDGTDPNGPVTREQFATMLYRYAAAKGYDVSIGESTNILSYADFASISEYTIPAMQWACGSGIVTGVTDSTLVPQGTATRAQCAAMLMRFIEGVK